MKLLGMVLKGVFIYERLLTNFAWNWLTFYLLLSASMNLLGMFYKDKFTWECLVTNVARYGHCFPWMKRFYMDCQPFLGLESTATLRTLVICLLVHLHMPVKGQAIIEHLRALVAPERWIILLQSNRFVKNSTKIITYTFCPPLSVDVLVPYAPSGATLCPLCIHVPSWHGVEGHIYLRTSCHKCRKELIDILSPPLCIHEPSWHVL